MKRHLVESAQRGNSHAFAALIRAYERMALSVAFGILQDADAAGDVAQLAFIRVWQHLAELRDHSRFGGWLCGIVRNLAIDARRARRPAEPLRPAQPMVLADRFVHDPAEEACRNDRFSRIAAAISLLDESSRMAIVLRYYEGLPSARIAQLLQISPEAVDMRLSRARRRLRSLLPELCADGRKPQLVA